MTNEPHKDFQLPLPVPGPSAYPAMPGHNGDRCSAMGAAHANHVFRLLETQILSHLAHGPAGPDATAQALGTHWLTLRTRFSELAALNLIQRTAQRTTSALGHPQGVYRLHIGPPSAHTNPRLLQAHEEALKLAESLGVNVTGLEKN